MLKRLHALAPTVCTRPRSRIVHFSRRAMASTSADRTAVPFDRADLESVLQRRFFFIQSFEIYGGATGFYDMGPAGAGLQANILDAWRRHFVVEDEMLEVDTTILTLDKVLQTSGHVDRFTDWMCRDTKTGDIFRADHLLEAVLEARIEGDAQARGQAKTVEAEVDAAKAKRKKVKSTAVQLDDAVAAEYRHVLAQIDNYQGPALWELMQKFAIKAPETGNDLTEPIEFNLMFDTSIGPTGHVKGYLRPETAQGHFINFARLLDFNNGKVPFASAQIGKSFRNEIAPRQGLLRVREFVMAEIEHYVDPLRKDHARFDEVADFKLALLAKDVQLSGSTEVTHMAIGEAVAKGIVDNQTLGYFLVRIHLFLVKIGIDPARLRFRQHMANEMAHYASDCWDAEIQSSYGWIECVGCADRSAYDLTVHSAKTGAKLVVREALAEPVVEDRLVAELDKKKLGPAFKKEAGTVAATIEALDQERLACVQRELEQKGSSDIVGPDARTFTLTPEFVKIVSRTFRETTRTFTPNVVEPSFGIGRILYSLLEHAWWLRPGGDGQRGVLSLPPGVAPIKVLIVPISSQESFRPIIKRISAKLRQMHIACRTDDSGASIGKRYARNDELGTPYGLTVDFASVQNGTITIRERDSTNQRIGPIDDVLAVVRDLVSGDATWADACGKLAEYSGEQAVEA